MTNLTLSKKFLIALLVTIVIISSLFVVHKVNKGANLFSADGVKIQLNEASPGLRVADDWIDTQTSTLIDKSDITGNKVLPCAFCYFLKDGRFFSYQNGSVRLWSGSGELIWNKKTHVHHDAYIDEEREEILLAAGKLSKVPGKEKLRRDHEITVLNYRGDEIFSWKIMENKSQFRDIIGKSTEFLEGSSFWEFNHLNSVQTIPATYLSKINPAFSAGNILVFDIQNTVIFVIDRQTKKIVWHSKKFLKDPLLHSVRLLKTGELVFFRNMNLNVDPNIDQSSVDFMNPITGEITQSIKFSPKDEYFSPNWGALQVINDNRFLVTYSASGSAIEIDRDGKIYWKWLNPQMDKGKRKPIYRISLLNSEGFAKSMFMNPKVSR